MRRSAMALLLAHTAAHIQFERCCDKYEPTVAVARMLREDSSNGKGRGMSADPARWSKDPGGVHELRWPDGRHWTAYVADAGVPSIEAAEVAPWPPPIEERWSGSSYVIAGGFLVAMLLLAGAAIATNIPPIPHAFPSMDACWDCACWLFSSLELRASSGTRGTPRSAAPTRQP